MIDEDFFLYHQPICNFLFINILSKYNRSSTLYYISTFVAISDFQLISSNLN